MMRRSILSIPVTIALEIGEARLEVLLAAEREELARQVGGALAGFLDLDEASASTGVPCATSSMSAAE